MPPFFKRVLHWIGSCLALFGIIFVFIRLNDYSSKLDFSQFNAIMWAIVAGFALLYSLANIMLALAWWNLLAHFGIKTSRLWSIRVYGLTQLAKYVPGNIFHLASRQAMGLAAGFPGWPLAKASAWELLLISITGALFSVLVIPHFVQTISISLSLGMFFCLLFFGSFGVSIFLGKEVARCVILYTLFLTISSSIFIGLLTLVLGESLSEPQQALYFCGAFVVAWLIGLVTPGAPAGVGVRELILMLLLKGQVPEVNLLLAILLSRMVTVSGDFLFYIASFAIPHRRGMR